MGVDQKVTHNNFFCVGIADGMLKFHQGLRLVHNNPGTVTRTETGM